MRQKTLEQNSAQDFAGLQIDQLSKLRNGNITFEQVKWFNNLSYEQRQALMGKQIEKEMILRLISGAEELKLDAVDGKQTIHDSKGVFVYIDGDFKNYGANTVGSSTKEISVDVYEMVKNATFAQMFGSLGNDLDKLCLTQHQILNFISKNRNQLRSGGNATFFLFKSGENFFVANVDVNSDGLHVDVNRFENVGVWDAGRLPRVVVPQLIP